MSAQSSRPFAFAWTFTLALIFTILTGSSLQGQTFQVIYSATGGNAVSNPSSRVTTQGRDGDMYFTSNTGGTFYGTFFKVSPSGAGILLTDVGYFPASGGTLGSDGNYYGTNTDGGPSGFGCGFAGCGQLYKISPSGTETILYSFLGQGDGSQPTSAPTQATNGIFYGTTPYGGTGNASTAYSVTSAGTFKTLHTFSSAEGELVYAELLQARDGNFYGTAQNGGTNGYGTIFKMTSSGTVTVLHNFDNTDGAHPCCGLMQATDGNLYGVAFNGGTNSDGVVFKITTSGTYTVLHNLNYNAGEGVGPVHTLTQGTDGKLYGVTASGGGGVSGTAFNVTTGGTFKTLYTFCTSGTCTDGYDPSSPLKQNTNGIFYGCTNQGGANNDGEVYSINMGLKAFASLEQTSGKEGAKIGILGQGFTSKSVVKFDGIQATAVTLSGSTFLTATVPSGALTGAVTVTTGSTTLTTPQTFYVTPTLSTFSPSSGPVGTVVTINGTGFEQTSKVTFNGKTASFTVVSDTEVTATVPSGATSGKIVVTTKGGSVTSTTNYTVN